jgi:hypothetical protein
LEDVADEEGRRIVCQETNYSWENAVVVVVVVVVTTVGGRGSAMLLSKPRFAAICHLRSAGQKNMDLFFIFPSCY